jgi:homoserine kinase
MGDTLHQPYRIPLFPESQPIMDGLVAAGALGASWSGAGSTMIAVTMADDADSVRLAGEALLAEHNVNGRSLRLEPDRDGLVVTH